MAACLLRLFQFTKKVSESSLQVGIGSVRNASKKTGGSTRNSGATGKPAHRGWKKQSGQTVTAGTILAIQYNLRWCPGLNVGIGKRGQLYAKVPGKVYVTCEKTDFDPNNAHVKKWYPDVKLLYKKYYNVIPEPPHQRFKLVETY